MECPECNTKVPNTAKFCPECGIRLNSPGLLLNIEDSVITRSPGLGSNYAPVINVSNKEKKTLHCPNCDNEITSENKSLICMECGVKFCENCEGFYRQELRRRGEKPLCYICYTAIYPQFSVDMKNKKNSRPFMIGEDEFDYIDFFNNLREMTKNELPDSGDPDGHIWYRIPAGISGAHFEWYFELFKWRRLGVEIHFESKDRRLNQKMLSGIIKYSHEIEGQLRERIYVQRNWGRTRDWSRLYIANTQLDNIDELKIWAAEKMKIFYRILQPRLKEI